VGEVVERGREAAPALTEVPERVGAQQRQGLAAEPPREEWQPLAKKLPLAAKQETESKPLELEFEPRQAERKGFHFQVR